MKKPFPPFLSARIHHAPGADPVVAIDDFPDLENVTADQCAAIGATLITLANDARQVAAATPLEAHTFAIDYSINHKSK